MIQLVLLALVGFGAGGCLEDVPWRALHAWELEVDGVRSTVELPAHLGRGLDQHAAVYTLRTQVTLEDDWRGRDVTLGIPVLHSLAELRVNGQEIPRLDDHTFDRARVMSAHRFRIDRSLTTSGRLALELTVHHVIIESRLWDLEPRLALGPYGDRWTRCVNLWNVGTAWITLISLLTLAMMFWMRHLSAFVHRAHRTVADGKDLELAKLAGGGATFAAVQLGLLQPILGRRDLGLIIIALLITIKASIQLTRRYLGVALLPRWTSWVSLALAPIFILISGTFLGGAWALFVAAAVVLIIIYLIVATYRRAGRERRKEMGWMIVFWCSIAGFSAFDLAESLGCGALTRGLQLTCMAFLVFVQMQAYLLSRNHTSLLAEQTSLNHQLGRQVSEVELLNEELRRKVGDRSRELSAALRKLRTSGEADVSIGTVLGDRYRVTALLGAGAMGSVYRVERLSDGRALAAKVVRGRVRPDTLERFTREAELTARVDHPHVVRVFDVDVTSDGELFLIMELVEGRSLEEARPRFGDLRFAETVVGQIASALEAIHGAGIVHRDLKPANVLVSMTDGPQIKVADFGIAGFALALTPRFVVDDATDRVAHDATLDAPAAAPGDPKLTETGVILGTPLYMAPEVLHGTASIGPAADLFSLGLIAYQLFGGPRIERAGTFFREHTLAAFTDFAPQMGAALADALQRCLHRDPTLRPTAQQLAALFAGLGTKGQV